MTHWRYQMLCESLSEAAIIQHDLNGFSKPEWHSTLVNYRPAGTLSKAAKLPWPEPTLKPPDWFLHGEKKKEEGATVCQLFPSSDARSTLYLSDTGMSLQPTIHQSNAAKRGEKKQPKTTKTTTTLGLPWQRFCSAKQAGWNIPLLHPFLTVLLQRLIQEVWAKMDHGRRQHRTVLT